MNIGRIIWKGLAFGGALAIILISIIIVCYLFVNRDRLLYSVNENGYRFDVYYQPGGGATGPPNDIEVRVTGGKFDGDPLLRARAFDTLDVSMPDPEHVKIVVLSDDSYQVQGQTVTNWRRFDSTIVELRPPLPHPPYIRRFK